MMGKFGQFCLAILLAAILFFFAIPAISLTSIELWWFLFGVSFLLGVFSFAKDVIFDDFRAFSVGWWIATLVVVCFIAIVSFLGSATFNASRYYNTVQVNEGNFVSDYEDIATMEKYVTMDLDTARRLGDRVLGTVPNPSWYEINDEYNLIIYQGKEYRISPLEYGGFFKYLKAKKVGIPGYVLVDCSNNEAKFVKTDMPIKYSPNAYLGSNLKRHLRFQFSTLVFESHYMEIDDAGIPYWVSSVTNKQAGLWSARKVTGFVLTNACTGESKRYALNEKPEWLDHVYGLNYLMRVASWHYDYVHGLLNSWMSKTDVLKTTYSYAINSKNREEEPNFYGYNCYVNKYGEVMIFTGITPANRTESNVGFLTINTSTGEFTYYAIPGAEESSAQSVVEGLVQYMGYQATYPFMVNVAGKPTYMMNLKDKSGLIQRYALVSLENYSKAYVGTSFAETLNGYLNVNGTSNFEAMPDGKTISVTGIISEKYQVEIDGTTYFYYFVDGKLYRASIKVNESQVLLHSGDKIEMEVIETIGDITTISKIRTL